jgi:hypothetical protein
MQNGIDQDISELVIVDRRNQPFSFILNDEQLASE